MTRRRWVVRAFPRSWRARFGEQLTGLLDDVEDETGRIPAADRLDVARAGFTERLSSVRRLSHHPRILVACGLVLSLAAAGALTAVESGSQRAPTVVRRSTTSATQRQVSSTPNRTAREKAVAEAAAAELAAEAAAAQAARARLAEDGSGSPSQGSTHGPS